MAEFQNIIRQLNRLCEINLKPDSCSNTCPLALLHKKYLDAPSCKEELFVHPKEVEQIIAEWAAEHPEPVYPTFAEWLNSIGVTISDRPFPTPNIPVHVFQVDAKMFEPIPADIAQKIGIKPKKK